MQFLKELITALNGGVDNKKIVFHGNNKSDREIEFAMRNKIKIVVDNSFDLERLITFSESLNTTQEVMVRFTPGIECHTHEYIKTGSVDSKFGFGIENLEVVFRKIKESKNVKLVGLHAHIGSQIFELDPHNDLAEIMVKVALEAQKFGHTINELNLGGGLGVKYIPNDDPPTIDEWVETISKALIKACEKNKFKLPTLMCEPGRSIVATSGVTIYKLGAFKEIPGLKTYILLMVG